MSTDDLVIGTRISFLDTLLGNLCLGAASDGREADFHPFGRNGRLYKPDREERVACPEFSNHVSRTHLGMLDPTLTVHDADRCLKGFFAEHRARISPFLDPRILT